MPVEMVVESIRMNLLAPTRVVLLKAVKALPGNKGIASCGVVGDVSQWVGGSSDTAASEVCRAAAVPG